MRQVPFNPTPEQERIIGHSGSAFVSACPGAGKTRVLVERARVLLSDRTLAKGVAFLSFTNAAISELEQRLRHEGLLPSPPFPHFVGTFDGFLWQYFVAPFGVSGCENPPRLIPDIEDKTIQIGQRKLPLSCFDRTTGAVVPNIAKQFGFAPDANPGLTKALASAASAVRKGFSTRGYLDFDDLRELARDRLKDEELSSRLSAALSGRFVEVIVDEAQDCNPADLEIIQWLRHAGVPTKVVCDPHQSIYHFRGGVTEELIAFGQTFEEGNQLTISGNFRSSEPICKAIVALRPAFARTRPDRALGKNKAIVTPVHIVAYPGPGVPNTIGKTFSSILSVEGFDLLRCPVLAATRKSGANAIGQVSSDLRQDLTLRLAAAVSGFYLAVETAYQRAALDEAHRVVLEVEGRLTDKTYHQYLAAEALDPASWRPRILHLLRELRYEPQDYPNVDSWLAKARTLLAPYLPADGQTISQRLRRNSQLPAALVSTAGSKLAARTIHAVKGMEFPAVCVVMTSKTTRSILDFLETGASRDRAEEARKIYVAASRAERLLVLAVPQSQAKRLGSHLSSTGAPVTIVNL